MRHVDLLTEHRHGNVLPTCISTCLLDTRARQTSAEAIKLEQPGTHEQTGVLLLTRHGSFTLQATKSLAIELSTTGHRASGLGGGTAPRRAVTGLGNRHISRKQRQDRRNRCITLRKAAVHSHGASIAQHTRHAMPSAVAQQPIDARRAVLRGQQPVQPNSSQQASAACAVGSRRRGGAPRQQPHVRLPQRPAAAKATAQQAPKVSWPASCTCMLNPRVQHVGGFPCIAAEA